MFKILFHYIDNICFPDRIILHCKRSHKFGTDNKYFPENKLLHCMWYPSFWRNRSLSIVWVEISHLPLLEVLEFTWMYITFPSFLEWLHIDVGDIFISSLLFLILRLFLGKFSCFNLFCWNVCSNSVYRIIRE